jgi:hypothetical protein
MITRHVSDAANSISVEPDLLVKIYVCENILQDGKYHRDYLRQAIAKRIDPLDSGVRQQDT